MFSIPIPTKVYNLLLCNTNMATDGKVVFHNSQSLLWFSEIISNLVDVRCCQIQMAADMCHCLSILERFQSNSVFWINFTIKVLNCYLAFWNCSSDYEAPSASLSWRRPYASTRTARSVTTGSTPNREDFDLEKIPWSTSSSDSSPDLSTTTVWNCSVRHLSFDHLSAARLLLGLKTNNKKLILQSY